MALHRYPVWEDPEIDDWRDAAPSAPRCFPLGAIVGIGAVGLLAFCRPRRFHHCYPRLGYFYGGYPYNCYPYTSCTPTYICYPRSCFPYPLY